MLEPHKRNVVEAFLLSSCFIICTYYTVLATITILSPPPCTAVSHGPIRSVPLKIGNRRKHDESRWRDITERKSMKTRRNFFPIRVPHAHKHLAKSSQRSYTDVTVTWEKPCYVLTLYHAYTLHGHLPDHAFGRNRHNVGEALVTPSRSIGRSLAAEHGCDKDLLRRMVA